MAKRWIIHGKPHPLIRQKATLVLKIEGDGLKTGDQVSVLDWFDRETGRLWRESFGMDRLSPESRYMKRRGLKPVALPLDNNVVLVVKQGGNRYLVHDSEVQGAPL